MRYLTLLAASIALSLQVQAQGPIAHYDFSGGAATDITGNGHDGNIIGSLPSTNGKCGAPNAALDFSPGNYIQVPSSTDFDLREWSVTATVMLTAFESGTCQVSKILQRGGQYTGDYICMEVNDNYVDGSCGTYTPTGQQPFGAAADVVGSYLTPPTGALNLNQWYCITAVYKRDTMRTYIDGVLNHEEFWLDKYTGYPSVADLLIGKGKGSGGMTYYFSGAMDDLAIYDRALLASEIPGLCEDCNPCSVDDVQYCSSLSTPFVYNFTSTVMPSSNCTQWTFGDGSGVFYSAPGASISHPFPGGGNYKICARSFDCATGIACGPEKCFEMCLNRASGAKSAGSAAKSSSIAPANTLEQQIGTLYPNPASTILNVPVTGLNGAVTLTVRSMEGINVQTKTVTLSGQSNLIPLNIASLKTGTYTLEITHNNQKRTLLFSKL